MPSTYLEDRGVVRVDGPDACTFLQGLVTCNMAKVAPGRPAYGALLTPQGKIICDFIVSERGGVYLLDCPLAIADELAKRLRFYKLRARINVTDLSPSHGVAVVWDEEAKGEPDPRYVVLGVRMIGDRAAFKATYGTADASRYEALRIEQAIPRGGVDFAYGDTFPHEANLDLLNGVDFKKGCYVGQEVVSRVEHRNAARKRIKRVEFDGPAPAPGTPLLSGDIEIGVMGSSAGRQGLAMLRIDRLDGVHMLTAGETRVRVPNIGAR